ncbi:unnamed protein product [Linum tenue]|uniref:Uncharacterized protein n=1 Tax=Linum tenue TaxID=586396 RepID=A0AAV0QL41_9ROSI|nr:unnamed protein product [Linum tenue]
MRSWAVASGQANAKASFVVAKSKSLMDPLAIPKAIHIPFASWWRHFRHN